jgi:exodeoxyribonuclease V alpha subunit
MRDEGQRNASMNSLSQLVDSGTLAPIDAQFGGLLARRAAARLEAVDEVRCVGLAGALLSAERARGNSCLELASLAGTAAPWRDVAGAMLPDLESWRTMLERSGLCGDGAEPSPLVMEDGRLYLYRYHAAECRLASAIRARVNAARVDHAPADTTIQLFRRLFAAGADAPTDWQAVAAAATMRGALTVITGGPGTGKTTTVAKILALLLHENPALRIALAAPTGKAATRLAESIRAGATELPLEDALRRRIPTEGKTLHRLLGYRPWNDQFAHGPHAPLAEDVVIVDEASMVDVLMMDALFAALRPSARVILLGDRDQLASVDTGYVLGDLCRAADGCGAVHGEGLAHWYQALSGQTMESCAGATPQRDAVVRLVKSYRFERQPGLGALAECIRRGSAGGALEVLADAACPDATRRDAVSSVTDLLSPVASSVDDYLAADNPEQALDRLAAFRVLCALREGRAGVDGLNEQIERWLRTRGVPTRARWYEGKPVLVTANDQSTGLFNGDVGVTTVDGGRTRIWFRDGTGQMRAVAPARLPAHETAWAMTVHKSQGSEFGQVLLVLPDDDSRVLTRELLYTGVTRARMSVDIIGSASLLQHAIERTTVRASGLAARLEG